ncbi:ABC transporter ATP-binding protein [Candidatus Poriferisocius sp.]|uniref:ABC transporter ATP-binding protein n=1 Tax=Candidatus Poriferisocius sp. TaxID=3101276 RepID=UPI003B58E171
MTGTGHAHLGPRGTELLRVEDLVVEYSTPKGTVYAVSGVSFDVRPGETLGLVGESGCGKSTTGRALLQLPPPTSGTVEFEGVELTDLDERALRSRRHRIQMIFQDPRSSLNRRRRVRDIVGFGLRLQKQPRRDIEAAVDNALAAVGLDPATVGDRRPPTFSGGQCQRISIARALVLEPRLLVCDEPVSGLDVSVQAQILNLLAEMKRSYAMSLLFISHDLGVVKAVSDRVVVMYMGRICEVATTEALFDSPRHPYTRTLMDSIPRLGVRYEARPADVAVELPSPLDPPSGCRFRTHCPLATDRCRDETPTIRRIAEDHFVACHHAEPLETAS